MGLPLVWMIVVGWLGGFVDLLVLGCCLRLLVFVVYVVRLLACL